jgi:hypothetical protein
MKQASQDKRDNRNRLISHSSAMRPRGQVRLTGVADAGSGRHSLQDAPPNHIMRPE